MARAWHSAWITVGSAVSRGRIALFVEIVVHIVYLFDARSGMLKDCLPHLFGNPQAGKLTPNRSADIVLDEVRQLNRSEIVASFPRQRAQRAQHSTVQPLLRLGAHPDGAGAVRG